MANATNPPNTTAYRNDISQVTGIVGAAGGLGGFLPPLVMGSIFGHSGDYGTGLLLLAAMAVLVMLLALTMRRTPRAHGTPSGSTPRAA